MIETHHIEAVWPAFLEWTCACLRLPSFSRQEREVADLILDFFKERGIAAVRFGRGSVLAYVPASGEPPSLNEAGIRAAVARDRAQGHRILAFNAHMDVVEAGDLNRWSTPPFSPEIRDGRLYARGATDMKGALAAMVWALALVQSLKKQQVPCTGLMGSFVPEEEAGEGLAFGEIVGDAGLRPDAVLLGEPSKMQIARGQRGKLECVLSARGRRAHTSVPEVGDNAAYKLCHAALAIDALNRAEFARCGGDPERMLERNTLVLTSMQTIPQAKSSVPEYAEATMTVRLARGANFETIRERLAASPQWPEITLERCCYRGTSYAGVPAEWPSEHPAWEVEPGHPFLDAMKTWYVQVLGRAPQTFIWPFSTDGVVSCGRLGIPTLGIGPGEEESAHIIDESVSLEELRQALTLYASLAYCPIPTQD
jgi:putative selenium metabolism hydrolase